MAGGSPDSPPGGSGGGGGTGSGGGGASRHRRKRKADETGAPLRPRATCLVHPHVSLRSQEMQIAAIRMVKIAHDIGQNDGSSCVKAYRKALGCLFRHLSSI